jgi:benzoate-CoA ligase family protein
VASERGNVVDYLFEHRRGVGERDRIYLSMPQGELSFGDVYARACRVGGLLLDCGVGIGDRVLFSVVDGPDFPALFLGAMKIGAVALPISTYLKPKDYAYYLKDCGAKVVVVDKGLADTVAPIAAEIGARLFISGDPASLDAAIAGYAPELETCPRAADDPAFWLYSSGTTGDPKGVVHTHDHIYWATELFGLGAQQMNRDDVLICPPKMFFAFGLGNQVYFPLRAGAQVIADAAAPNVDQLIETLIRRRPTLLVAVPTIYANLLQKLRALPPEVLREAFGRMRFCVSGGEMLAPVLLAEWREVTGVEILDGVGTTEMTHMFLLNRPGATVPGSCGRVVDGFQARLLDDDGHDVAAGDIGSLFVTGPTAAREYWNKPEKSAAAFRDGGVLTGDKFRRDEAGNFFYVGRNDDMLRVGGIWVSPAEIESALSEHPAVLECAVIGAADVSGLTKTHAYIVLRPDTSSGEDDMAAFLRGRLAHFKCPRRFVFVDELPKTATGKILRYRLRETASL